MENNYNLVVICSAIATNNLPLAYTPTRSYFTHQQRFEQTLKTIESIRKYIPNSYIVLAEGTELSMIMFNELSSKVNYIHKIHLISEVYEHINGPHKGLGEAWSLLSYLQSHHYKKHEVLFNTINKISGRYFILPEFEWKVDDNKIVCNIRYDNPHHPSHINMSTMFYTVGYKIKNLFIESLELCCKHPELHNGVALEHVLPNCMISKNILFYQKMQMNVGGEYGPWGGYVCN
jgi:hypothetical protein